MQTPGQGRPQLTDVKLSREKMKVLAALLELRVPWVRGNCLSGPRGTRGSQGWTASPLGPSVWERRRGPGAAGRLMPSRHSLRKGPLLPPQPRSCCLTGKETWRAALATARQGLCPPTAPRHAEAAPVLVSLGGLCFPFHLRSPKAALGHITGTLPTRRCPLTGAPRPCVSPVRGSFTPSTPAMTRQKQQQVVWGEWLNHRTTPANGYSSRRKRTCIRRESLYWVEIPGDQAGLWSGRSRSGAVTR